MGARCVVCVQEWLLSLSAENVPHVLGLEQALAVHVRAVTLASPANLGQEETQDIYDSRAWTSFYLDGQVEEEAELPLGGVLQRLAVEVQQQLLVPLEVGLE